MTRLQVMGITKSDRYNPHERILAICGVSDDGIRWKRTQDQTIHDIESGRHEFFVRVNERDVDVIVASSRYGNQYLKTEADGEQPNNLLSLPECL